MDDAEHEQFEDDSGVEISDIPGENAAVSDIAASPKVPYWPFRRPVSPRQRALQLTVIISVVALTLLVILGSSASVRDALIVGIFGPAPTPTPTLAPGSDLFYIEGTPSWGRVSIDGRALSRLPIVRITPPPATNDPPLQLARGRHQIVWRADPFQPQSCFVLVPELNTDTCRNVGVVEARPGLNARIIIFSESLATLAADQRTALVQETQATLDSLQSTEIVQPGEQFVHVRPKSQLVDRAVRPLRATLSFQLDTDITSNALCSGEAALCVFGGQDCRLFCTQIERTDPVPMPLLEPGWNVTAIVRSTWEYATLDGQVIAGNQPDDRGNARDFEHFVSLKITWDGTRWYVSISGNSYDLACASAQEGIELDSELQAVWKNTNQTVQWQFGAGPNLAVGCLVIVTIMQDSNATPSSPPPVAYLLHRFGIFLAANGVAHHYWPNLPLADTYEKGVAQSLATPPVPQ